MWSKSPIRVQGKEHKSSRGKGEEREKRWNMWTLREECQTKHEMVQRIIPGEKHYNGESFIPSHLVAIIIMHFFRGGAEIWKQKYTS